ncbi:Protein naked cuticle like protein [Trachymyrmex septentrionalis]|uniref:Protein naked cuticle homolog n=1 Tax=Trachymyrmex septentrionalis TaxID=34720 RepID=A0A195FP19_9HYME|nr:Protein naked cuticle like protein [Trachymyrmex septentrionalis]
MELIGFYIDLFNYCCISRSETIDGRNRDRARRESERPENGFPIAFPARAAPNRSVVGTNTEGSDSEELLTGVPTTCNVSSPPTTESQPILISPVESPQVAADSSGVPAGPTNNDEQPTCGTTKQLSFEEFECDVSVADGDRRRQEFSFTLYDFDGHGKITKDDIAGLVTTIYDTLGASIQVPPCGSKTIKVKLTVSPDQRGSSSSQAPRNAAGTCLNATQTSQTATLPDHQHNPSCCHLKHAAPCSHATAAAATTATRHGANRVPRRRRATRYRCQTERKEVETHSEDDDENARTNRVQQEELRRRVGPVPHLPSPYSNSSEGDVSDDSDTSPAFSPLTPLLTTNQRKRSGALQRQQLLEIIQANMEKNNLSFHTSRKRHQNEQSRIPSHSPHVETSNHNNQDCHTSLEPRQASTNYHKPIRESTHHSVSFPKTPVKSRSANLRKTRHTTPRNNVTHSSPQTYTTYSQLLNRNVIAPTIYNDTPQHTNSSSNVHRNIVNVVPNNNQQTANHQTITNNRNNLQRNDAQFVQTQCGRASKKHQLKHATREQDQARAMAQVVRWLEREFSQNAVAATSSRKHVHEHIHHHYHHYHAEALV